MVLVIYFQVGGHHQNEEFAVRGKEPKDEVQIYTWKDATLRELTDLVIFLILCFLVLFGENEILPSFILLNKLEINKI